MSEGEPTGKVNNFHATSGGLLLGAANGLFRYDGTRVINVGGEATGAVSSFHDAPGGLLLRAVKGMFRYDGTHIVHVES